MKKKVLVIYYSWKGKTELVARSISRSLSADLQKIEETKKRRGIFGFLCGGYAAAREKCSNIRPLTLDFSSYDFVLIGTPVWARKPAPAVNSFINQQNFYGKKVALFATMGGFGGKKACLVMKDKIKRKGGRVVDLFYIKTGGVKKEDIEKEGEKIGKILLKKIKNQGLNSK